MREAFSKKNQIKTFEIFPHQNLRDFPKNVSKLNNPERVSGHMAGAMSPLPEKTESSSLSAWLHEVNHMVIAFPLVNVSFPGLLTTGLSPLSKEIARACF